MPAPMGREKGQGTGPFPITLPNGNVRYRVAVTMPDGRRVWRTRRSKREAEQVRRDLVEARELDLDPTRQTLAGYLRSWIAGFRAARNARIRPRTLQHYEGIVEKHIIPALGGYGMAQLTPRRIQAWLDEDQLSARSVHHHHAVLRRALNVAVRQRLLPYNPADHVELPKVDRDHADPLTADEAHRLLEATRGDRLYPLWRLALITALRQGELLGLAWDDVAGDAITVRSQLQRLPPAQGGDPNGWARTPPKAARSVERVTIDADTAAVLADHRMRQAADRRPDWGYFGLVFVTQAGNPYHPSVIRKAFLAACAKAGIRARRFHDLRGTSLTLMRDAGVTEDTRMARAGHSTTTIARHYAKASETQDRDAANRLAQAIDQAG